MLPFDSDAVPDFTVRMIFLFLLIFSTKTFTFGIRLPFGLLNNIMQDDNVSLMPCHQPQGPDIDYGTCYLMKSGKRLRSPP